jgi:hypothetical protein
MKNVRWGIKWGLVFASVLSGYVLLLYVLRGAVAFDRVGTSVWGVVLFYFSAGIVAGGLVGILRPIATSRLNYVLVATIGTIPVITGAIVAVHGLSFKRWPGGLLFGILAYSVFMGVVMGSWAWNRRQRTNPSSVSE